MSTLPENRWALDLQALLTSYLVAALCHQPDAHQKWQAVVDHWCSRFDTEDGGEGNSG